MQSFALAIRDFAIAGSIVVAVLMAWIGWDMSRVRARYGRQ